MDEGGEDDFFGSACTHCGQCFEEMPEDERTTHCPFYPDDELPCQFDEDLLIYEDENGEYKRRDED